MLIFADESGELGFKNGSSRYYVVGLLCTDQSKTLKKAVQEFDAYLIRRGWPKDIEIKAATLFNCKRDETIPDSFAFKQDPVPAIYRMLNRIGRLDVKADAIVVNKHNINEDLRTLPFGILHNYYAGQIIVPRVIQYDGDVHLIVDKRCKERHPQMHFDGYIRTKVFWEKGRFFNFEIRHEDSQEICGLRAADFVSWSVNRLFASDDDRFFARIKSFVKDLQRWYF